PLGTRWMGLSEHGIGIHGTPSAWSIGSPDSHGCIRMYISDAEDLFEYAQVGSSVEIYGARSDDSQNYLVKNDRTTFWNLMLGNGFISADILRDRMAQDSIWRDMLIYGFIPDDVLNTRLAGNSLWDKMLIHGFIDEATFRKIYKNILKSHTFGMAGF
ncbi:MAG: L,D-transpeptidase, partial [Candidatus Eremiobacterota bacterium]